MTSARTRTPADAGDADPRLADPRLSPADTKIGTLQRALLRVLLEHEAAGMLPTNGRFLFYELEQRGIVSKVATGKRRADQDLSVALTDLRARGIVPWEWVIDETRDVSDFRALATGKATMREMARLRLDPWGDDGAPILLVESRSLAGVLDTTAYQYALPITSTNGQARGHLETKVLTVYREARRVLYLGDMDLAGGQIEKNTRDVLEQGGGSALLWERLAITREQIDARGLTPILKTDKRYADGGAHEAWETEALTQATVLEIVRTRLEALLPEPLADVREREETTRARYQARIARWRD